MYQHIVQRALFSATISPLVRELADGFFLRNPVCISVGAENAGADCMCFTSYYGNRFWICRRRFHRFHQHRSQYYRSTPCFRRSRRWQITRYPTTNSRRFASFLFENWYLLFWELTLFVNTIITTNISFYHYCCYFWYWKGLKPPVLLFVQSIDRAKQLFVELVYDGMGAHAYFSN